MALSSEQSQITYAGNNSAVTPYVIPFPFLDADDIYATVIEDGVARALAPEEYSVTRNPDGLAGTLTTTEAVLVTDSITAYRDLELVQPTEYPPAGPFPAESFETALDRQVMQIQQLNRRIDLTPGVGVPGITIPTGYLEKEASTTIGQDANGALINRTPAEEVAHLGIGDTAADAAAAQLAAAQAQAASASYPGQAWAEVDYTELRTLSGIVGSERTIYGQGGGVFTWIADTVTDDSGIYIAAAGGGTWVRKFTGDVSVLWWGADPTGVADSAAAFQAALDTGFNVEVPLGTFKVDSTLTMFTTGQFLSGSSLSASILNFSADANGIEVHPHTSTIVPAAPGAITDSNQYGGIRDLRIRYTPGSGTKAGVIMMPRLSGSTWNGEGWGLFSCHFEGWNYGCDIEYTSKFQAINCHGKGCTTAGGYFHGSPNNCLRIETFSASDCPTGLLISGASGATVSIGDTALNAKAVHQIGGSVHYTGGEIESYTEAGFYIDGGFATICSARFLADYPPVKMTNRSAVHVSTCFWNLATVALGIDAFAVMLDASSSIWGNNGSKFRFADRSIHATSRNDSVYCFDGVVRHISPIPWPGDASTAYNQVQIGDLTLEYPSNELRFTTKTPGAQTVTIYDGDNEINIPELIVSSTIATANGEITVTEIDGEAQTCQLRYEATVDPGVYTYYDFTGLEGIIIDSTTWTTIGYTPSVRQQNVNAPNLRARRLPSGTKYLSGWEDFVIKTGGGKVILPNPSNLALKANHNIARSITIYNDDAAALAIQCNDAANTTQGGVVGNTSIPAHKCGTYVTTGGTPGDWAVMIHP